MSNSRFAVATHILTGIALNSEKGLVSSDYLASSVNTNPVVVRRIIQDLVRVGLLRGKPGKGGGSELALPPDKINLFQVYQAVQTGPLFDFNPNVPNKKCPLSCRMKELLEPVFESVDKGLEDNLKKIHIQDLIQDMR